MADAPYERPRAVWEHPPFPKAFQVPCKQSSVPAPVRNAPLNMAPTYSSVPQPACPPNGYTSGARFHPATAGGRRSLPPHRFRQPCRHCAWRHLPPAPLLPPLHICPHTVHLSPLLPAAYYPYGAQQPCAQQYQQPPAGYTAAPGTVPPRIPQTKTRKAAAKLAGWVSPWAGDRLPLCVAV